MDRSVRLSRFRSCIAAGRLGAVTIRNLTASSSLKIEVFSHLVLEWDDLARRHPTDAFRHEALKALHRRLAFSSAWWGIGIRGREGPRVIQSCTHNLPPAFADDWLALAERDTLAQSMLAHPGVTILGLDDDTADDFIKAFDQRYDIGAALSTCTGDEDTGIGMFLSIYRARHDANFTEEDRSLMQLLIPHLMLAAQTSWRFELRARLKGPHTAIIDRHERVIDASVEFCENIAREWPQWRGDALPDELVSVTRRRGETWSGEKLAIHFVYQHDGRVRLEMVPRIKLGLSASQEKVAREYAAGRSYREIAAMLGLSPATVRTYLRECYIKLGVRNKVDLGRRLTSG